MPEPESSEYAQQKSKNGRFLVAMD